MSVDRSMLWNEASKFVPPDSEASLLHASLAAASHSGAIRLCGSGAPAHWSNIFLKESCRSNSMCLKRSIRFLVLLVVSHRSTCRMKCSSLDSVAEDTPWVTSPVSVSRLSRLRVLRCWPCTRTRRRSPAPEHAEHAFQANPSRQS